MREWKQCLPPLFTALTVLVLALLPSRLSGWEDREFFQAESVHAEPLGEDSNFPAKPPDLSGRVRLLVQWQNSPGSVTIVEQYLEDFTALAAEALAREALAELTEAGILPSGQPGFEEGFNVTRLYLRDLSDLSSAGFLLVESQEMTDYYLTMALDLETGLALSFRLSGPDVYMEASAPETMGRRFLDRLGVEYQYLGVSGLYSCAYHLPDCQSVLTATVSRYLLKFGLGEDWSGLAEAYPEKYEAVSSTGK